MRYDKPPTSIDEQIALLLAAERTYEHISTYLEAR